MDMDREALPPEALLVGTSMAVEESRLHDFKAAAKKGRR
jgi:hypothetical protein